MCALSLSRKDLTTNIYSKDNKYVASIDSVLATENIAVSKSVPALKELVIQNTWD